LASKTNTKLAKLVNVEVQIMHIGRHCMKHGRCSGQMLLQGAYIGVDRVLSV